MLRRLESRSSSRLNLGNAIELTLSSWKEHSGELYIVVLVAGHVLEVNKSYFIVEIQKVWPYAINRLKKPSFLLCLRVVSTYWLIYQKVSSSSKPPVFTILGLSTSSSPSSSPSLIPAVSNKSSTMRFDASRAANHLSVRTSLIATQKEENLTRCLHQPRLWHMKLHCLRWAHPFYSFP